jgi:hypothetical protein
LGLPGRAHQTRRLKGAYEIVVNIITPHCPITSDGKAPNLELFDDTLCTAISVATRKAQHAAPKENRQSQKDLLLDNLDQAIADVSGLASSALTGSYPIAETQVSDPTRGLES